MNINYNSFACPVRVFARQWQKIELPDPQLGINQYFINPVKGYAVRCEPSTKYLIGKLPLYRLYRLESNDSDINMENVFSKFIPVLVDEVIVIMPNTIKCIFTGINGVLKLITHN